MQLSIRYASWCVKQSVTKIHAWTLKSFTVRKTDRQKSEYIYIYIYPTMEYNLVINYYSIRNFVLLVYSVCGTWILEHMLLLFIFQGREEGMVLVPEFFDEDAKSSVSKWVFRLKIVGYFSNRHRCPK